MTELMMIAMDVYHAMCSHLVPMADMYISPYSKYSAAYLFLSY